VETKNKKYRQLIVSDIYKEKSAFHVCNAEKLSNLATEVHTNTSEFGPVVLAFLD